MPVDDISVLIEPSSEFALSHDSSYQKTALLVLLHIPFHPMFLGVEDTTA
jgi:hypothetical protein